MIFYSCSFLFERGYPVPVLPPLSPLMPPTFSIVHRLHVGRPRRGSRTWRCACACEGHLCFSYTPAPSARVSFWYSFGISSRRGDTIGEKEVGYGTRARCKLIGRPVKKRGTGRARASLDEIFSSILLFALFFSLLSPSLLL